MTWHDPRVTKAVLHSPAKFPKRFRTQIARKKALTKSNGIPLVIYELMNSFHVLYNCRDLEHLRNCSQYSLLVLSRFPIMRPVHELSRHPILSGFLNLSIHMNPIYNGLL